MNEINNISSEKKKLSVTVKNIIRTLTFCCVILFFCPMFMVSCSDSDWGVDTDLIKVSAVTAIKGISSYGETLVSPQPVIALCLLLPVAVPSPAHRPRCTDHNDARSHAHSVQNA